MTASRIGVAALLAAFCLVPLTAQDPAAKQDPEAALKETMKARYPLLESLRDAGKVGESPDGMAKLVKASFGTEQADAKDASKGTVASVVDAENKDRKALYELFSKKLKLSPAEVGKQNGLRNFEKAKPDHWVEVKGEWVQRKVAHIEKKEKTDKPPAGDKK